MIVEYHRPDNIEVALQLLARKNPITVPLGGGSSLSTSASESLAVVDLQKLQLNKIVRSGTSIHIGATVTLQELLDQEELFPALKKAIVLEATYNIRHAATIAGILVQADGRSPFSTVMLALSAQLLFIPGDERIFLGDFYPFRKQLLKGRLISKVIIPANVKLAYHYVARTPADSPIVCVGVAQWPSGRTRVALGGHGHHPILGMDAPESSGIAIAARNAFLEADNQWASAEYRSEIAAVLVKRCLSELGERGKATFTQGLDRDRL